MTDNKKKEIYKIKMALILECGEAVANNVEKRILSLCESIRAEALKEIEGEIEKLYNEKYSHVTRDYRTEDQFRDDIIGQHGVLAKLSKEEDEEEICICGQDDPTANGMRMDIICPKHDET